MSIGLAIAVGIFVWFMIGLTTGFICSWIDCKYNNFNHYNWTDPFKMSFLGILILIWLPFFYRKSKIKKALSW